MYKSDFLGAVGIEPTTLSLYLWDTPPHSLSVSPVDPISSLSVDPFCCQSGKRDLYDYHDSILFILFFLSSILSCFLLASCYYVFKYISYILLWYSVDPGDWFDAFATVDGLFDVFDSWVHIILESNQLKLFLPLFALRVIRIMEASKNPFRDILPILHSWLACTHHRSWNRERSMQLSFLRERPESLFVRYLHFVWRRHKISRMLLVLW